MYYWVYHTCFIIVVETNIKLKTSNHDCDTSSILFFVMDRDISNYVAFGTIEVYTLIPFSVLLNKIKYLPPARYSLSIASLINAGCLSTT